MPVCSIDGKGAAVTGVVGAATGALGAAVAAAGIDDVVATDGWAWLLVARRIERGIGSLSSGDGPTEAIISRPRPCVKSQ